MEWFRVCPLLLCEEDSGLVRLTSGGGGGGGGEEEGEEKGDGGVVL